MSECYFTTEDAKLVVEMSLMLPSNYRSEFLNACREIIRLNNYIGDLHNKLNDVLDNFDRAKEELKKRGWSPDDPECE